MNLFKIAGLLFLLFVSSQAKAQTETYSISVTPFSSSRFDEFSPVFYRDGIVYSSNQSHNLFFNYAGTNDKGQVKIQFVPKTSNLSWGTPDLLSKELTSKLNDGPATFNNNGDTVYFSRNLEVEGKLDNLTSSRNKLGIFSAVLVEGEWAKIRELRINSEWYNVTTPWLSPDGKQLFFTSDKPGGLGGTDIYYSQRKGDFWGDPVNLGPVINTKANESYPSLNSSGELFFSSDGHPGLGGKDIYFSRLTSEGWSKPIHLDAPVNSQFDETGILTDDNMSSGYFSSNRNGSFDIFRFTTNFPQAFYTNIQRKNQYCFMFSDTDNGTIVIDSTIFQYRWSFGDGTTAIGKVVNHCFSESGNYNVKLDIVEKSSGILFLSKLSYDLDLKDFEQPFINSPDVVASGVSVDFDALNSYLPGFQIMSYSWDFGDDVRLTGDKVSHIYKENGEYFVNLGLSIKSEVTGKIQKTGISKKIVVSSNNPGRIISPDNSQPISSYPDIRTYDNASIKIIYSAEADLQQDAVFVVEILSSKTPVSVSGNSFRNVPKEYTVKEVNNTFEGVYSYIVDRQMDLMATYPAYKEMLRLGFKETRLKVLVLKKPDEKELHNLIRIYGAFADSYFDNTNRLTSNAYIMLDQLVKLMNKYPALRLELAVHSDNTGVVATNQALSQRRAELLTSYLVSKNIDSKRLVAKGFGGSRPIAPNFLEKDRKLNRRIDFTILD